MSDDPFIYDDEPADDDDVAHVELSSRRAEAADRLNQRHIKAILVEKRAMYRHRTYLLLAAVVCVVAAGQLVWIAVPLLIAHQIPKPLACIVVAIGCSWGAFRFFRRAAEIQRELRNKHESPAELPDFSTLSDGSHFASNLENLRDD